MDNFQLRSGYLPALFILGLFYSCAAPELSPQGQQAAYFDIPAFVKKEIGSLSSQDSLLKTYQINGKKESRWVKITDWSKELSMLAAVDINKPSFRDLYELQTVQDSSNAATLSYRYIAKRADLFTQSVAVLMQDSVVLSVGVVNRQANAFMQWQQYIDYHKGKHYRVRQQQSTRFWADNSYEVELGL